MYPCLRGESYKLFGALNISVGVFELSGATLKVEYFCDAPKGETFASVEAKIHRVYIEDVELRDVEIIGRLRKFGEGGAAAAAAAPAADATPSTARGESHVEVMLHRRHIYIYIIYIYIK